MAPVANISLLDSVLLLSTPPTPAVRLEGATEAVICWDYKEVLPWLPGLGLKEGTWGWECGLQLPAAESELWSSSKETEGIGLSKRQDIWLLAQSYYSIGIRSCTNPSSGHLFLCLWSENKNPCAPLGSREDWPLLLRSATCRLPSTTVLFIPFLDPAQRRQMRRLWELGHLSQ